MTTVVKSAWRVVCKILFYFPFLVEALFYRLIWEEGSLIHFFIQSKTMLAVDSSFVVTSKLYLEGWLFRSSYLNGDA